MSTRIIEVKSCDNCPYAEPDNWAEQKYCAYPDYQPKAIDNHPFPAWCPLPEIKKEKNNGTIKN